MIRGTSGNDVIGAGVTTAGDDSVRGLGGDDSIDGLGGNDRLLGDDGNDTLDGSLGDDRLRGGLGADVMSGGAGNDDYVVDDPGDVVSEDVGGGIDIVRARVSFTLAIGQEIEIISAEAGSVGLSLTGNELDSRLVGGAGDDILDSGAGNDRINGRAGNDTITTSGSTAVVYAGEGDDTIRLDGSSASTGMVDGGTGNDIVRSADLGQFVIRNVETLDTYYGFLNGSVKQLASFQAFTADLAAPDAQISFSLRGAGGTLDFTTRLSGQNSVEIRDAGLTSAIDITGSVNGDRLLGSGFNDRLTGGNGDDLLLGGDGRDKLLGGADSDRLNGGNGNDKLTGDAGSDVFIFDTPIGVGNVDRISDFAGGVDTLEIHQEYYFPGLMTGQLDPSQFAIGSASGPGPQIVYDSTTGALHYDSNGADAGGSTLFAVLSGAPALAETDFLIV